MACHVVVGYCCYAEVYKGAPLIEKSSALPLARFLVAAVLAEMDIDTREPEALLSPATTFSQLPLVVLLKIFTFLSLEKVLQLEQQCRHLHHAVLAYLKTLKTLNAFRERVLEDRFWRYDPVMNKPSDSQFAALLSRCPSVTRLSLLRPTVSSDEPGKAAVNEGILSVLIAHKNIAQIDYCSSLPVAKTIFESLPLVTITTLRVQGNGEEFSLPRGCKVRALRLSRVVLVSGIPSLPLVEQIEFSNVKLTGSPKASLEFPRLRSFSFSGSPPAPPCFTQLLTALTRCPLLTSLEFSLSAFDGIEDLLQDERSFQLSTFKLRSIGLFAATFQQYRFAGTVAQLCTKNASSIEHLNLPSSILTKQFFRHFIDNSVLLPKLKRLDVNGIADTKLFLAPGNLVEGRYYQDFLRLCPQMASLSLHSYSGSLAFLALPLTLTEVTLPWDNRLNLDGQRDSVRSVVATIPGLLRLSIAGVEEVEGILLEGAEVFRSLEAPDLSISSDSLLEFKISNVCIKLIGLKGCTKLSTFSLHCCPILKSLTLPADPVKHISIYDSCQQYTKNFVKRFISQRDNSDPCHIHIQLHSVRRVTDVTEPPQEWCKWLLENITGVLASVAHRVDYFVVQKLKLRELEHNSGEPMFPCTEFHPDAYRFRRSQVEIESENNHRSLALEGVRRWVDCLSDLRQFSTCNAHDSELQASAPCDFSALYCGEEYKCSTNVPWVTKINQSPLLSQPSSPLDPDSQLQLLNVPRLDISPSQCHTALNSHSEQPCVSSEKEPPRASKPLLVISAMEFVHNIHTLFYPS